VKKPKFVIAWNGPSFTPIRVRMLGPCECDQPHANHTAFINERGDGRVHYPQEVL